ncbi:MAG: hypothetical protein U1F98_16940 [Verrucomicrobiota bacterium]
MDLWIAGMAPRDAFPFIHPSKNPSIQPFQALDGVSPHLDEFVKFAPIRVKSWFHPGPSVFDFLGFDLRLEHD